MPKITSHPEWVRGLKPTYILEMIKATGVAPRVGAWIETAETIQRNSHPPCRTPSGCVD